MSKTCVSKLRNVSDGTEGEYASMSFDTHTYIPYDMVYLRALKSI